MSRLTKAIKEDILNNFAVQYLKANKAQEKIDAFAVSASAYLKAKWSLLFDRNHDEVHQKLIKIREQFNTVHKDIGAYVASCAIHADSDCHISRLGIILPSEENLKIFSLLASSYNKEYYSNTWHVSIRLPESVLSSTSSLTIAEEKSRLESLSDSQYQKDVDAAFAEVKKLADDYDQACSEVNSVLSSVTTVKRLLEVWPEAEELLPPILNKQTANVPARLISGLNEKIGLPTDKS